MHNNSFNNAFGCKGSFGYFVSSAALTGYLYVYLQIVAMRFVRNKHARAGLSSGLSARLPFFGLCDGKCFCLASRICGLPNVLFAFIIINCLLF